MAEEPDIELEGHIEASSKAAILFRGDYMDEAAWIPRSQSEILSHDTEDGRATLKVRGWIAKKNGWN